MKSLHAVRRPEVRLYLYVFTAMLIVTVFVGVRGEVDGSLLLVMIIVNLATPLWCLTLAVLTANRQLSRRLFAESTTTIRTVATAWLAFWALGVLQDTTDMDFENQLNDLYVVAALTSVIALAGPGWSDYLRATDPSRTLK